MIVLTPDEMKEVDARAIGAGFPDLVLMETAGRGAAELAREITNPEERVLIFAGKGNNGGDGLVVARLLDMWGYKVKIILLASEDRLGGNTFINYRLCRLRKIEIELIEDGDGFSPASIKQDLEKSGLIIDSMLGTGLKGEVREPVLSLIDIINEQAGKTLAIDIPSGLDGEEGKVLGKAVRADYTATMAYPKIGLTIYPGREYTGRLEVIDLGVPEEIVEEIEPAHFLLTAGEARNLLPERPSRGHKGTFGKVFILGGSRGMAGAPALTGMAALKTGSGLVWTGVPTNIQPTVASFTPELITRGLNDNGDSLKKEAVAEIEKLREQSDVMAVGPGLGCSTDIREIVFTLLQEYKSPLILDADGLNVVNDLNLFKNRDNPLIITPHPGEMARLSEVDISGIEEDRIGIARKFASDYHLYLILKGAATVIALPDGRVYINTTGNEGMATGGSGDVLTGIISSLIGQGLDIESAVVLGPYIHGLAADQAKKDLTSYSLTAGDIIRYIPEAIKEIKMG